MSNPLSALSPYEYHHLTSHIAASGAGETLDNLLAFETASERNAWFEAKQQHADVDAFIADVELAATVTFGGDVGALARRIRYAVLLSSARSVPPQVLPNVILAALRHRLWTIDVAYKNANL